MAMTKSRPFGSVLTAMVTPMHADGAIYCSSAALLARHLVATGHDGIVVSGTTGESPTTHSLEKAELIRVVKKAVGPGVCVVAGVGSNDTTHTVRMTVEATTAGADGLLVVTPYYSKPSASGVVVQVQASCGCS